MQNVCILLHWSHFSIGLQLSERSDCSERRREVRITVYIYYILALCYPMHSFYCHANFVACLALKNAVWLGVDIIVD